MKASLRIAFSPSKIEQINAKYFVSSKSHAALVDTFLYIAASIIKKAYTKK
jgi:hypothetical protein